MGKETDEHFDVIALMLGPPASCCAFVCVCVGGGVHVAVYDIMELNEGCYGLMRSEL